MGVLLCGRGLLMAVSGLISWSGPTNFAFQWGLINCQTGLAGWLFNGTFGFIQIQGTSVTQSVERWTCDWKIEGIILVLVGLLVSQVKQW